MIKYYQGSKNPAQKARDIMIEATFLHCTFKDEIWLWRGESDRKYSLEPGMHTRVINYLSQLKLEGKTSSRSPQELVNLGTANLLDRARELGFDRRDGASLPDLALLATLQHYGAATPLLDVTTDPLVALWMVAFASPDDPKSKDTTTGSLYGILKPKGDATEFLGKSPNWIDAFDSRRFVGSDVPSISETLEDKIYWYQAPDVTERLRIQRGSFILGDLSDATSKRQTTLPFTQGEQKNNWVQKRIAKMGQPSNTFEPDSDVFVIHISGAVKKFLRILLQERSGLTISSVYPLPWDRPSIEKFSSTYGRSRALSLDIRD